MIEKNLYNSAKPIKVDYINGAMGAGFSISSNMQLGSSCGSSCSC